MAKKVTTKTVVKPIEEIVVIGQRPAAIGGGAATAGFTGLTVFDVQSRETREKAIKDVAKKLKPKTEIVVKGKRGGGGIGPRTKAALDPLFKKAFPPQVMEKIVVTAKRAPVRVPFGFAGGAITGVASVGAMIADQISQQRLDAAFRRFQAIEPRQKDSPVRRKQPERIPEIVVKAKRPRQIPLAFVPDFPGFFADTFARPAAPLLVERPDSPTVSLRAPRKPRKKVKVPSPLLSLVTGPGGSRRQVQLPDPGTRVVPRSFAMGIGRPGPRRFLDPLTPRLSFPGGGLAAAPLPQPSPVTAGFCPPCPKKKKKRRNKCYRQLVKQGLFESRDKVSKWAEIDCRTGKTIKELI